MSIQEYIQSGAIENGILGMASEEELRELAQMRQLHPEVNAACLAFEAELEAQCLAAAVPPPAGLQEKINAAIGISAAANKQEAPVIPLATGRKPIWMQYAAVAGVALLLGSMIMNFMLMGRVKKMNDEIAELKKQPPPINNNPSLAQLAFMQNPEITPVSLYGVSVHNVCRCSLFWDQQQKKAYLVIHHLFSQPEDKDYQLWAFVNGQPVSAGIFRVGDKAKPLMLENIPAGASGFAVTLEKKGGSPKPTLEQLYLKGQITT